MCWHPQALLRGGRRRSGGNCTEMFTETLVVRPDAHPNVHRNDIHRDVHPNVLNKFHVFLTEVLFGYQSVKTCQYLSIVRPFLPNLSKVVTLLRSQGGCFSKTIPLSPSRLSPRIQNTQVQAHMNEMKTSTRMFSTLSRPQVPRTQTSRLF